MNIQKNAIDIGIIAKDIDAMLAFYRDALGLEFEAAIPMPEAKKSNPISAAPDPRVSLAIAGTTCI